MDTDLDHPDSFLDGDEPKSSKVIWEALAGAKSEFDPYLHFCDNVDRIVSASGMIGQSIGQYYTDQEFDLLWSSLEIIKPAVYSRPPKPVVAPRFSDRNKVATTASEMLERCLSSTFERGDFDQVMLNIRDDLIISARGVPRIRYETDDEGGGKRICEEHVDRRDFLHEPARKWSEVGWVAFAAYLSERQMKERFDRLDDEILAKAQYSVRRDDRSGSSTAAKCKVWEVWHKADNRVYWVTEGVDVLLDESEPFLKLDGFFPCPRPAYGTLRRRSLIPVPDYIRFERHLDQINTLTSRIYALLEWIRVKGLIPAGGDVGTAVQTALAQVNDDVLLIPVPGAALMQGSGQFVQFLPLQEFAGAIQGLIEARTQLINDFYQLSGISDIMRGYVDAEEKLGQSQLKSQFGSVRVREKIDELQRVARDVARIAAEIIAEKFGQDELLEMSQMDIPTKAAHDAQVAQLQAKAKQELDGLAAKANEAMAQAQQSGKQIDPAQAEQQFQQQQQAIVQKYQPLIKKTSERVTIDDIMKLLRDQKSRGFSIEIETDSTIMVDELAEKQARSEFLTAFSNAIAAVQPLLAAGEVGAKLAGGMMKFSLAPFRVGRELDGMIDDFVEAAPAALAQQQGDGGAEKALAEANQKIAEAELQKAQAAIRKVEADTAMKTQEMQVKAAEASAKAQADQQRIGLEMEQTQGSIAETSARIKKIEADIQLAFAKIGLETQREQREDVKAAADIQMRQTDQAMSSERDAHDIAFRHQDAARSERQQMFSERQGARAEDRADRQQSFTEKQADAGRAN